MTISLVCCMDLNRNIGYKNKLLAHLPADLKHFKNLTKNTICIQGRKTYESIIEQLGHSLPDRTNIVLTNNTNYQPEDIETIVYYSVDDIIREYREYGEEDVVVSIIGGSTIYEQFLPYSDKLYLTIIQHKFEKSDAKFPAFDLSEWDHRILGYQKANDKNKFAHYYLEYTRKK